jgi:uracil phosphoribosyltransferase
MAVVSKRLMHITEISKSRLKDRMSMLLDPMTATSSSTEKCLECKTNGAG